MIADVACMALAIYFEARSENFVGKIFVADTIMNRVKSKRYKNNVCDVVMRYKQFSFLNDVYDNQSPLEIKEKSAWSDAVQFAFKFMSNPPDLHDSCHYATHKIRNRWTKQFELSVQVGAHSFYKGGC